MKNKGTKKLKKIVARAKKLYKPGKGKKWITCIKEASKKV
jgi:hypothetical protein